MNIYVCLCIFIHIYTHSCIKNFLHQIPIRVLPKYHSILIIYRMFIDITPGRTPEEQVGN